MKDSEYFEIFSAENILREEQVDPDDVESGLTASTDENKDGTDGGIDAFYLFVNGKLIRDDQEATSYPATLKKNIVVNLVIIQASTEDGFTLGRLTRLSDTIEDIFTLQKEVRSFSETYSELLRDAITRFRSVHQALLLKRAEFHVTYVYATKGRTAAISPDIRGAAIDIEKKTRTLLATIHDAKFTFLGARELIDISKTPARFTFSLRCAESISLADSTACVALVHLKDFLGLLRTDKKELRTSLFESNVRDYQGEVAVNTEIGETLKDKGATKDFWWLNNGITIVAQEVGGTRTQVTLEEPQIVNGLQTSQQIFDYFAGDSKAEENETRHILVRMIPATTTATHDSIIRATNRQTAIPAAYLWATSQIHRDIETVLNGENLHYDRRKNSWRREHIPFEKVVGITELAQSVAAILRQEPDHARARPIRYFSQANHPKVFSSTYIRAYAQCARIKKRTASYLKKQEPLRFHRNNLLFYLMMAATCLVLKTAKPSHAKIEKFPMEQLTDGMLKDALNLVRPIYRKHGENDQAAKGMDMSQDLKNELRTRYPFKNQSKK